MAVSSGSPFPSRKPATLVSADRPACVASRSGMLDIPWRSYLFHEQWRRMKVFGDLALGRDVAIDALDLFRGEGDGRRHLAGGDAVIQAEQAEIQRVEWDRKIELLLRLRQRIGIRRRGTDRKSVV